METTLGGDIKAAAVLDRDFRSDAERSAIKQECEHFCDFVTIHSRKEIENFLLVPSAIDRAAAANLADRCRRTGNQQEYHFASHDVLDKFAEVKKDYILAQFLANRRRYERSVGSGLNEATYNETSLREFNELWKTFELRMALVPGKEALSYVNEQLQLVHSISITPTAIIDSMRQDEIPAEVVDLVNAISEFSRNR